MFLAWSPRGCALRADGCRCVCTGAHEHFRSANGGFTIFYIFSFSYAHGDRFAPHEGGHLQPGDTSLYKQITDWLLFLLRDTQVVSSLHRQDPQGDACLLLGEPMTVS